MIFYVNYIIRHVFKPVFESFIKPGGVFAGLPGSADGKSDRSGAYDKAHALPLLCEARIQLPGKSMKVKLWGVRGSYPTPLSSASIEEKIVKALTYARPGDISSEEAVRSYVRELPISVRGTYGGNTTAIEVRTSSNELLIIDCGSGIINLGREMMAGEFGKGKGAASVFLTHTHWDHIQGMPFFPPFYIKGNRFNFYSPVENIQERIEYQQALTHFPITFDTMMATKRFFTVKENESFYLNDVKIFTRSMPHPGSAYGVRIEDGSGVFVYTSDCEFNIDEMDYIQSYSDLFHDADLLIFDAQYTFQESVIDKMSWGHSSASIAIDIAARNRVKRLVLFHHDPGYDDEKLNSVLLNAKTYLNVNRKAMNQLDIDLAYEGMVFNL